MHSLLERVFVLFKRVPLSRKGLVSQKLQRLLPPARTWYLIQKPIEFFLVLVYEVKQFLHMLNQVQTHIYIVNLIAVAIKSCLS